jgi:hypothetical protein
MAFRVNVIFGNNRSHFTIGHMPEFFNCVPK